MSSGQGRGCSVCLHESEVQAGAEVEADFQASRLVGLNSECMVVVPGLRIGVYPATPGIVWTRRLNKDYLFGDNSKSDFGTGETIQ